MGLVQGGGKVFPSEELWNTSCGRLLVLVQVREPRARCSFDSWNNGAVFQCPQKMVIIVFEEKNSCAPAALSLFWNKKVDEL
jgi:hypothetical protein